MATHSRTGGRGRKRGAAEIALPLTVGDLVAAGTLRDVPYIGPSSARIIMELVETGASSTVDAAVAASRNADKVASLRQLRTGFLSQVAMEQALALPRDPAVVTKGDCRGVGGVDEGNAQVTGACRALRAALCTSTAARVRPAAR